MSAGIRAGSSNDGYVQVNGNDIITALSGGNVGIGVSNPSTKLHVNGTITATNFAGSGGITTDDWIVHAGDTDTKLGFPAADQIQFDTGGTNYLKLHRYSSVNFVEVGSGAHISLAANGANSRGIMIGDGNASSTGQLFLQAGGGSTGFGGGIRLYSHANTTNAGGVYIGKSLNSSGSIIFGNGGTTPSHEYLKITSTGKSLFKSQGANAVWISLLDNDSSNEIWRVGQAADGDGYMQCLTDEGAANVLLDASGNSYVAGGNFGIGLTSPAKKLQVKEASSTSGVHYLAHVGGSSHLANYAVGIGFDPEGYTARTKIGIVAEGTADGYSRGKLHFLLDSANDSGEATLSESRMTILDSGTVGIAVASPDSTFKLDLNGKLRVGSGSAGQHVMWSRAGLTAELVIGVDGYGNAVNNEATIQSGTGRPLVFMTNGGERLRITSGGAVLIKATSTSNSETFRIHEGDSGKVIIKLTNATTGTAAGDGFEFGLNSNEQIEFFNKENTDMFFGTNNLERLRIQSDGNVGIARTVNNWNTSNTSSLYDLSINRESNNSAGGGLNKSLNVDNQYTVSTFRAPNTNRNGTQAWFDIAHFRAWDINAKVIIQSGGTFTGDQVEIKVISSYNSALNNNRSGPYLEVKSTQAHTARRFTKVKLGCNNSNRQPILQVYLDGNATHNANGYINVTVYDYGSAYGTNTHRGEAKFATATTLNETWKELKIYDGTNDSGTLISDPQGIVLDSVISTGSKTITGGNNLAIQNFKVKGVYSGSGSIGKSIELISGYDSEVKMAAIGYNLTDVNTGSTYGGDLTLHTQPLYSSPTTPLPVRMRVSSSGYVTTPQNPKFWYSSLSNASSSSATNNTEILKFATERHNQGSNYNTSNGRFTAPVSGTYHFTFNGLVDNSGSNSHFWAQLWRNGSNITNVGYTFSNNGEYTGFGGSACIYLAKDDYAQIYASANIHVGNETSFSGHLIG